MTQTADFGLGHRRRLSTSQTAWDLRFYTLVALGAVAVIYLLAQNRIVLACLAASVPLAARVLAQPALLLVALGASLPALMSVSGQSGGVHVAASDLLLATLALVMIVEAAVTGTFPALRALSPVVLATLPYAVFIALLLPFHLSVSEVAQSLQRYELFLVPLVVGAYAALRSQITPVLQAYVISSTALAFAWPFDHFGMQKNPVGQIFANAILLLVALPSLRRLLPCLLALVPALLYTESRGAIAATAIGLAVIVVVQAQARPLLTRVIPLLLLTVGVFALMPASLRARVTTLRAGTNTPAAYSLRIRQGLSADARRIIRAHPVTGIGVGNYLQADRASQTPADDPHEVLLLEAAEGGYGFAATFVMLVVGTSLIILRQMRGPAIACAALAVLIATATHGLVDVYWVRGTPVLGWLLVGMACGELMRRRQLGQRDG